MTVVMAVGRHFFYELRIILLLNIAIYGLGSLQSTVSCTWRTVLRLVVSGLQKNRYKK